MNIELNQDEIEELIDLIKQTWLDGFDSEALATAFEKLEAAQESAE